MTETRTKEQECPNDKKFLQWVKDVVRDLCAEGIARVKNFMETKG